jgi:hypothetical protein
MTWPKAYSVADAPSEVLEISQQLIPRFLQGSDPDLSTLREQYAAARVRGVHLTGVGFFVDFEVPPELPVCSRTDIVGGHATIAAPSLKLGAGCVLFVRGGRLAMLECFTYDDEWPEHLPGVVIKDVSPLLP